MKKFGGHAAAAGLSIAPEESHIQQFRECMQEAAQQQNTSQPTSYFISEFPIYNFPNHLFDDLMALEPYGNGHPKPSFRSKTYLHVDTPALGKIKNMLNSFFKSEPMLIRMVTYFKTGIDIIGWMFYIHPILTKTRFSYQ